jgi:hypothetical protein
MRTLLDARLKPQGHNPRGLRGLSGCIPPHVLTCGPQPDRPVAPGRRLETMPPVIDSLADTTVLGLSKQINYILGSIETIAENAQKSADQLAQATAKELVDMSSGRYGINATSSKTVNFAPDTKDPNVDAAKRVPKVRQVAAGAWAALANGALTLLETITPGERPENPPASKRERLGNLLGFDWAPNAIDAGPGPDRPVATESKKGAD